MNADHDVQRWLDFDAEPQPPRERVRFAHPRHWRLMVRADGGIWDSAWKIMPPTEKIRSALLNEEEDKMT